MRINGADLRVKVVGEGANLGLTQAGRIEFAQAAGQDQHRRHRQLGRRRHLRPRGQHQDPDRDPGAGGGKLTRESRNALLRPMTDDVASHVLATTTTRPWRCR
jgi:glutamate dehydrogenase